MYEFLSRRGAEAQRVSINTLLLLKADFTFSIISFHEQVMGAHTYIVNAKTPADTIRGYTLLRDIIQGFSFDAGAATIFQGLRSQNDSSFT